MAVYLPEKSLTSYFDMTENDLIELLFDISLNTPRMVGYVLAYCHATHITLDKKLLDLQLIWLLKNILKMWFNNTLRLINM